MLFAFAHIDEDGWGLWRMSSTVVSVICDLMSLGSSESSASSCSSFSRYLNAARGVVTPATLRPARLPSLQGRHEVHRPRRGIRQLASILHGAATERINLTIR